MPKTKTTKDKVRAKRARNLAAKSLRNYKPVRHDDRRKRLLREAEEMDQKDLFDEQMELPIDGK